MRTLIIRALVLALGASLLSAAGEPPWRARRRPHVRPNRLAQIRVRIADWPAEPPAPRPVDPERFAEAFDTLCRRAPARRIHRYARLVLTSATERGIDPFLLGALVYRESRCRADAQDGVRGSGVGLTLLHRPLYARNVRRGVLRYRVRAGGDWAWRERPVDRFPFGPARLRQAEPNLYFASALLAAWRDQHADLDEAFEQAPHRHFVSHWVWGDRVRSDRPEDRILTERRRLLEYYGEPRSGPRVHWGGMRLGCPLDGCPRVISSWLGSARDGGERRHRGVDLESLPGEPVRAIGEGRVVFAGVDLPGGHRHVQLRGAEAYEAYARDDLGAGGRYVCVRHPRPDGAALRSCYMHLEEVHVVRGQRVERGDGLGTVGRTGMTRSAAHLHLELSTDRLEDPAEVLQGLLLGHRASEPTPLR
ncbi:MAG: peptidoglycan DD-metalloendopeptidase family protein [Sandaracinaceae bacterium]